MRAKQEFSDVLDIEIISKNKNNNSQCQSPAFQENSILLNNKFNHVYNEKEENKSLFQVKNIAMQVSRDNNNLVEENLNSQVFLNILEVNAFSFLKIAQKQLEINEMKKKEKIIEKNLIENENIYPYFGKDCLTRDVNGNFLLNRKKKMDPNSYFYDFQYKKNSNDLTIEEINKITRQEMEKAFQLENLKQMKEKAKKKEIEEKMIIIQQELDDENFEFLRKNGKMQNPYKIESVERNFYTERPSISKNNIKIQDTNKNTVKINEDAYENMQNLFLKEIKKLKNEIIYQQNFMTGEILGIKGQILESNEIRKNAEDEIAKLKKEIAQNQYIDGIRQKNLYNALVNKNEQPQYFHTLKERIRDTDYIPNFKFPKNLYNYEDYIENNDIEKIVSSKTFFLRENNSGESSTHIANDITSFKNKNIKFNDIEIYQTNNFRLETLETGNPSEELERLDQELFNLYKKNDNDYVNNRDEIYDSKVDPILNKIKYPERYDTNKNKYI